MDKLNIEIIKLEADIDRKNKLLRDALKWLVACQWSVSLSVIAAIEKELEGVFDDK